MDRMKPALRCIAKSKHLYLYESSVVPFPEGKGNFLPSPISSRTHSFAFSGILGQVFGLNSSL